MSCDWNQVTLGSTGLRVTPLGLAPGLEARDVERAFERGINYLYWGSARADAFGEGIRNVARHHRAELITVVQSYTRVAALMEPSLERALRELNIEYTDLLLLGWWSEPPPRRIVDAALDLVRKGLARHIMISCHNRLTFAKYIADPAYGAIMVRYNAVHPGAEREVFPVLDASHRRPGVVSYTATRWGALIDPKATPPGEKTPRPSDCYRFALSDPHVNVVLSGSHSAAQLDEAMSALDRGPMSPDELAWIKRVGAHIHANVKPSAFNPVQMLDKVAGLFDRSSA